MQSELAAAAAAVTAQEEATYPEADESQVSVPCQLKIVKATSYIKTIQRMCLTTLL